METEVKELKEQKVAEEYLSSLADLNVNSKPLINMLTILAEENIEHASVIVKVVEQHIAKVHPDIKLPILYLIDSIVKNVKSTYIPLFSQCIVNIFCGVFEQVSEKIRERMYTLRQTWNEVFTAQKLYTLDVKVNCMDRNWPITAKVTKSPSIHVNPNFLKKNEMEATLRVKTRELLELEKRKLELELEATKKLLQEQEKHLSKQTESVKGAPELHTHVRHPSIGGPIQGAMHHAGPRGLIPSFHNYRNAGPRQPPPNMMNMNMQQTFPSGIPPQHLHQQKPKVHPVNPLLLNTIRPRDPRLARQQQQQQQQQASTQDKQIPTSTTDMKSKFNAANPPVSIPPAPTQLPVVSQSNNSTIQGSSSSYRNSKSYDSRSTKRRDNDRSNHDRSSRDRSVHDRSSKSRSEEEHSDGGSGGRVKPSSTSNRSKRGESRTRSESKSPTRARSTSARSSNRSGSSSRDKDRRGNSSKISTDRRKGASSNSRNNDQKYSTACPKIEEESEVGNETAKKNSNSPTSPPKYKDSKSKSNSGKISRSYAGRKHKSRSPSPTLTKDVDLRVTHPDKRARLAPHLSIKLKDTTVNEEKIIMPPPPPSLDIAAPKSEPDDRVPPTTNKKIDFATPELEPLTTNVTAKGLDQNLEAIHSVRDVDLRQFQRITSIPHQTTTSTTTTTPANVVQSINKLEKSSEILVFSNGSNNNQNDVQNETKGENKIESSDCGGGDARPDDNRKDDTTVPNGVPIGDKKRQSLDDPGEPIAKRSKTGKIDGLFGTEDVDLRTVIPTVILHPNTGIMTPPPPPVISNEKENWAKVKGSSPATKISPNKSSLDDVRAKLAKTAKFNKIEKSHKELSQRFKIYELQDETTSQECNDNKIREMISQAQESLESRSINEEQYQYLVKTAMQINETNKLNAAKRLESLNSGEKTFEPSTEKLPMDPDRLAREAVHKKRIPKLSKEQQQQSNLNVDSSIDIRDSPILVDDNSQENPDIVQGTKQQSGEKEKRVKISKWSAPSQTVNSHGSGGMMLSQQQPQRQRFGAGQNQGNNRPQFNNRMLMPSPWQNPNNIFNGSAQQPRPITSQASVPAPPQPPPTLIIPKPCNSVDNPQVDVVRTITIDGRTKEIRFYGDVAIVFMDWDQPREIGFQPGTRTITIDNKESIVLNFNEDYKEVTIDGDPHRMRFAFPSRELYINEHWYEVYFGGPAMPIPINNKMHLLQAEGPPPQVHIGILRRDLVVGKINMIVDARNIIPIFLDADPQTFTLDGKQHVIEFADNLKTVIINNEPMHVEYGGLPKSMLLGGRKYFVRFGALPSGIVPGQHVIKGMKYLKIQPPATDRVPTPPALISDVITNQQHLDSRSESVASPPTVSTAINTGSSAIPGIAPIISNIDELFQKLISTGILNTITNNSSSSDSKIIKDEEIKPSKDFEPIRPVKLHVPETIKTRQAAIINTLFCGMQCSSCGVRFPPEQTIKYSQHLDWHFRQNRRERDSSRKAHSRKWYYEVSDWLQYEEIEDLEDREKNFFESQQVDLESIDESSNQRTSNSPIPSCPAETGDVDRACDMCQEKFEQFYNEDLEEWHLRAAIRVEDKIYHPLCYEDYKASLNPPEQEPETETKTEEHLTEITIDDDNAVDVAIVKTENLEDTKPVAPSTTEDDDDDVIVIPTEEPSITEIDDDEEYVPINMSREEMGGVADDSVVAAVNETMESDVEIQEPNIPFTDLDTYVEKPSTMDETSQSSLLNVKIKEEPKDDEEEDDGFEDVGIVLIPEEEISIQSSDENTATRTISSTVSSPTPSPTVADVTAETSQPPVLPTDAATVAIALETPEAANSMDGNLEPNDNPLSTTTALVGVNKIKINMTKNIVTSNNSTSTTTITKSNSLNQNELKAATTSGGCVSNISTIPVLCSGATTISTMSSLPPVALGGGSSGGNGSLFSGHSAFSTIPSLCNPASSAVNGNNSIVTSSNNSNVIQVITSHTTTGPANMDTFPNSIPVIGSNSKSGSSNTTMTTRDSATPPLPSTVSKSPKSMVVEDEEPTFTFKQELQNVQLKKVKKIECGLEASGLCSIM